MSLDRMLINVVKWFWPYIWSTYLCPELMLAIAKPKVPRRFWSRSDRRGVRHSNCWNWRGTCGNYDNLTEPHCRFLNKEFHGIPVRQSFIQIRWSIKVHPDGMCSGSDVFAPVAMVPTGGKICGGHRQRHQDWGQAVTHRVGEVLQWDFFNFGLCRTVSPTRALLWPATAMFFIRSCPARRGDEG